MRSVLLFLLTLRSFAWCGSVPYPMQGILEEEQGLVPGGRDADCSDEEERALDVRWSGSSDEEEDEDEELVGDRVGASSSSGGGRRISEELVSPDTSNSLFRSSSAALPRLFLLPKPHGADKI